jgi:hypothetical protein
MWPSVVYQPAELVKSAIGARVWERAEPLPEDERANYAAAAAPLQQPPKPRPRAKEAVEEADEEEASFE